MLLSRLASCIEMNLYISSLAFLLLKSGLALPTTMQSELNIHVPAIRPQQNDTYVCHAMKLQDAAQYITEFIPHASMSIAHHMLLFACTEPGSDEETWNCGEMEGKSVRSVCKSGNGILYAWGMDAPKFKLPEGISFKVAGDTSFKTLVLQVHYMDVTSFLPPNTNTDSSGIKVIMQSTPTPKLAGIYLLSSGGVIPSHSNVYMDIACSYNEFATLHPFAYRVHTHKLGRVVSGYRVRDDKWTEIGRESPQKEQMFYPVKNNSIAIKNGDMLAARCVMENNGSNDVSIGPTKKDEMCNFYMMYWVNADDIEKLKTMTMNCDSSGFPNYSWRLQGFNNIPLNSAMLPNTKKLLRMSEEFESFIDKKIEQAERKFDMEMEEMNRLLSNSNDEQDDLNEEQLKKFFKADEEEDGDSNEEYSEKSMNA